MDGLSLSPSSPPDPSSLSQTSDGTSTSNTSPAPLPDGGGETTNSGVPPPSSEGSTTSTPDASGTDEDTKSGVITSPSSAHQKRPSSSSPEPADKIRIHFVHQGAPPLAKPRVMVGANGLFATLHKYLRERLFPQEPTKPLFLYVDSSFSPGPHERIVDLYRCFGARGELTINYCLQHSYG